MVECCSRGVHNKLRSHFVSRLVFEPGVQFLCCMFSKAKNLDQDLELTRAVEANSKQYNMSTSEILGSGRHTIVCCTHEQRQQHKMPNEH